MTAKSPILRNNLTTLIKTCHRHTTSNRKRYYIIDIAKGIAILLVVIGHFITEGAPYYYICINRIIYTFHMPLFMMASGFLYIATRRNDGFLSFVRKKTLRLMLPYIVTSFILLTIKLFTQGSMTVDHPVGLHSYIECLYSPAAGYFLWFLWALWIMFLVVYNFTTRQSRLLLTALAFIIAYIPIHFPSVFCLEQFRVMFIYFMTGIVLYDWKHYFSLLWTPIAGVITILLFICGEATYIVYDFNPYVEILLPYIGIATALFICRLIKKASRSAFYRSILAISSYSFFIYLFHTTFMGPVKSILMKFPFFDTYSSVPFIVLAFSVIIAGVVGPILTDKYIVRRSALLSFLFGQKAIRQGGRSGG